MSFSPGIPIGATVGLVAQLLKVPFLESPRRGLLLAIGAFHLRSNMLPHADTALSMRLRNTKSAKSTPFLITNYGFQTWQYAPQYALRSYSYLLPYGAIGKALSLIPITHSSSIIIFYSLRIILSLSRALCELYFSRSLTPWFGAQTSLFTFLFLTLSPGMFNCGAAYLPQQFVLCTVCLSFGSLFREKRKYAILWMGIAALIGWPFIVFLAVPMALDCILTMGFLTLCGWTILL